LPRRRNKAVQLSANLDTSAAGQRGDALFHLADPPQDGTDQDCKMDIADEDEAI